MNNKETYNKYIQPFIDYFNNNPKYISNEQIDEYLTKNKLTNNPEAINAFLELYKEIGAQRYILQKYSKNLETPNDPVLLPPRFDDYINSLKVRRYSRRTIKIYSSALRSVNNWIMTNHKILVDQLTPAIALEYL